MPLNTRPRNRINIEQVLILSPSLFHCLYAILASLCNIHCPIPFHYLHLSTKCNNIYIRIGGFPVLMTYLVCIGHVMDESGLKECLSLICTKNTHEIYVTGDTFARAVRGR